MEYFAGLARPAGWEIDDLDEDDCVTFARPVVNGIQPELVLDLVPREWGLSLSPCLGMRHVEASAVAVMLNGGGGRGDVAAGVMLSELMYERDGQGRMWTVEAMDEIEPTARQVLADVEEMGDAVFARFASLPAILDHLVRIGSLSVQLQPVVVGRAMLGDEAGLQSALRRIRQLIDAEPPFVAEHSERFLAEFSRHFGVDVR